MIFLRAFYSPRDLCLGSLFFLLLERVRWTFDNDARKPRRELSLKSRSMISTRFKDKRFLFLSSFPSLFHKRTAFTLRIDRLPAIPSYEQSMPIPFPVRFKSKPLSSSFSSSIVSEERIPLLAGLVARQIFIIQRNSPSVRSFPPTRRFILTLRRIRS